MVLNPFLPETIRGAMQAIRSSIKKDGDTFKRNLRDAVRFATMPFMIAGGNIGFVGSAVDAANGDYTGAALIY
jgi:hypothetical protein